MSHLIYHVLLNYAIKVLYSHSNDAKIRRCRQCQGLDLLTKIKYRLRNHGLNPHFVQIYCRKDGLAILLRIDAHGRQEALLGCYENASFPDFQKVVSYPLSKATFSIEKPNCFFCRSRCRKTKRLSFSFAGKIPLLL